MNKYKSYGSSKNQTVLGIKPNTWGQPRYVRIRQGDSEIKIRRGEVMSLVFALINVGGLK